MYASINYSKESLEDIHDIQMYIMNNLISPKASNNIKNKIIKKCNLITTTPEAYPYYMRTDSKRTIKYRTASVANYTIFYIYNKNKNEVKILRVIYSKRNHENIIHMVNLD